MAIGGFFKTLGKGARAVGRGAMKGVLGFDDRDISAKFKKKPGESHEEPDGDEVNEDYSGYSRGVADLGANEPVESDGFEAAEFGIEAPPEMAMTGMKSLIGLEMPDLPGIKRKGGGAKTAGRMGGGVKIEAPKTMPTAYETVTAGITEKPALESPGIRSMRGSITGDVEKMEGFSGATPTSMQRDYVGNTTFEGIPMEDSLAESKGYLEGTKDYAIGAATGPLLKGAATLAKGIPGLTRSAGAAASGKAGKALDWYKNANTRFAQAPKIGSPGYSASPGARVPGAAMQPPAAGPGKDAIGELLSKSRLDRARYPQPAGPMEKPVPGLGGVEGPMPPLPPGIRETAMEVLYSPRTKSLARVPR